MFDGGEVIKKEGSWDQIKYRTESGKMLNGYIHESQGFLMETYVVSSKDGYANIRWELSSNAEIAGTEKMEQYQMFMKKRESGYILHMEILHIFQQHMYIKVK